MRVTQNVVVEIKMNTLYDLKISLLKTENDLSGRRKWNGENEIGTKDRKR